MVVVFFGSSLGFGISFGASTGAAGATAGAPVLQPPGVPQPLVQVSQVASHFGLQKRALIRSRRLGFLAQGSQTGAQVGAGAQAGAQATTGAGAQTGAGAGQAGSQEGAGQQASFLGKQALMRSIKVTRGPQDGSQAAGQAGAGQQLGAEPPPKLGVRAALIKRIAVFTVSNLLKELGDASHGAFTAPTGGRENRRGFGCPVSCRATSRASNPKYGRSITHS